jgi:hypothetical protein
VFVVKVNVLRKLFEVLTHFLFLNILHITVTISVTHGVRELRQFCGRGSAEIVRLDKGSVLPVNFGKAAARYCTIF